MLLEDGQRRYVWGRGLAYATTAAGTSVAHVYHQDGLGTVRALTDAVQPALAEIHGLDVVARVASLIRVEDCPPWGRAAPMHRGWRCG